MTKGRVGRTQTQRKQAMFKDRRKSQRFLVNGFAQVQNGVGIAPRECRITNISDGGVRLYAESVQIADEFTLWLPGEGAPRRRCRVMWRLGPEVGAEFADGDDQGFARRMADAEPA